MDDSIENISDVSASLSMLTSTPKAAYKRQRRAPLSRAESLFKVPKTKPRKNPPIAICERCGRDYVRKKSFDDHMRLHALADANSRYPNADQLNSRMLEIARRVIQKMSQTESVGVCGARHNCFIQHLLVIQPLEPEWCMFVSLVGEKLTAALITGKFLLPSALLPIIYKVADEILTDIEFRKESLDMLEKVNRQNNLESMLHCFVCSFVHDLGEEIIIFISECVIGEKPKKEKQLIEFSIEDRQVIFYVAGCCFKGFLKKGRRWKKNSAWAAISEVIETRVREGNGVALCSQCDRAWTESQNRVNLFFIGAPAMEFMIQLAQIVYNVDCDEDGCFKDEDIMKDVYEDSIVLLLWDELVGSSLDIEVSLSMMKGIVKSFTSTYARGIANKKLNNHLKKAFHSMSLRHAVAPRQTN